MLRCLSFLALFLVSYPTVGASLSELTGPIKGRRMRASSHNLTSRNRDHAVIEPGQTITLAELEGPGIIQHIWFTVATREFRFPAKTILRIYWDDSKEPSVQTPLGDFFAAGHGMTVNVNSQPVQVSAEGRAYNCYWPMPFKRKARIEVENQSDIKMDALYYYIDWMKPDKPKKDAYYFHAQYRQERPHTSTDDYTILETTGRGNYVGTVLSSQCGYHCWFGEGDDLVFIDGEAKPRLTGTGTEDYFNDAWGFREFNHPWAGCTIFEGRSIDSRVTAYRWHIADPIPFNKSIKFTIEAKGVVSYENGLFLSGFHDRRDNLSSVAFWYQDQPAKNVPKIPPLNERIDPEVYLNYDALTHAAKTESARGRNRFSRWLLPRRYFQLKAKGPGSSVTFPIELDSKGRYSVSLWKVGLFDGGIYEVYLDGKRVLPYLDFYQRTGVIEENGKMIPLRESKERKIGLFYLDSGKHELKFQCIGRNPQSHLPDSLEPGYNLGLHGLSFRKALFENMDQYLPPPITSQSKRK